LLFVSSYAPALADPPHIRTEITMVFTGWDHDQFGILTVAPTANPANCPIATAGYMTDHRQSGYNTYYAVALLAYAERATVEVVVSDKEGDCIVDRPRLIGLNIRRSE
jgi:hypothetical protein